MQFAGYSSDSLAERMLDSKAKVLITADGVWRGEKLLLLKSICDEAMMKVKSHGHEVESCVVVAHLRRLNNPQGKESAGGENATLFAFETNRVDLRYVNRFDTLDVEED